MTDTYGNEPHDHDKDHDEVLTHGQDAVHEAPSDYEFSDEHGGAAASEEHADEHNAIPADEAPARRSPLLPIIAAVGGIVLLGGVAWWQFGGSSDTSAMMGDAPISVNPEAGMTAPPPVLDTTVTPKTAAAGSMAPVPTGTPPQPAPVAATQLPPVVTTPVKQALPGSDDPKVAALNSRIDDLQKSIQQTSDQLAQIATAVTAATNNKQTDDRLDKLEQQIAQLSHPAPTLAAPTALPAGEPSEHAAVKRHKPSVTTYPDAERAPRHHVKAHKTFKQEESRPVVSSWVLRAASPGQAWVSSSATSHDLKPLHVGDTLAGVGRVTAIQQQGTGSWVVQGTKGSLQ